MFTQFLTSRFLLLNSINIDSDTELRGILAFSQLDPVTLCEDGEKSSGDNEKND